MMTNKLIDKKLFNISDSSGSLNLFTVAFPIMIQNIFTYFTNTVHTYLMSDVSAEAVAAIGVTNTIFNAANAFVTFASLGVQVLISYELGRGSRDNVNRLFTASGVLASAVAVILALTLSILAPSAFVLYKLDATSYSYAVSYFRIRIMFLLASAITCVFYAVLRCFGKTSVILSSSVLSNVINLVLCVFTVRADITDFQKVVFFAYSAGAGMVASLLFTLIFVLKIAKFSFKFPAKYFKDISALGLPAILGNMSYQVCNIIITGIIATFGTKVINANVFTLQICSYACIISLSLAPTNSIMLGRLFGRGDIETGKRLVRQNLILAFICNFTISFFIFIFGKPLMHIYTNDSEIIKLSVTLLFIDIFMECFRSFSHVLGESALVCAKDTVFTSTTSIVISWVFGVGGCFLMCRVFKLGIVGARLALLLNEAFKGTIFFVRWKLGKWAGKVLKST